MKKKITKKTRLSAAALKGWETRRRNSRVVEDRRRRELNRLDGYYSPAFFNRSLGH